MPKAWCCATIPSARTCFAPAVSKERTQKRFLLDMVQRVFDGSPSQLVLQALGGRPKATREEVEEIRALLDKLEGSKT